MVLAGGEDQGNQSSCEGGRAEDPSGLVLQARGSRGGQKGEFFLLAGHSRRHILQPV